MLSIASWWAPALRPTSELRSWAKDVVVLAPHVDIAQFDIGNAAIKLLMLRALNRLSLVNVWGYG